MTSVIVMLLITPHRVPRVIMKMVTLRIQYPIGTCPDRRILKVRVTRPRLIALHFLVMAVARRESRCGISIPPLKLHTLVSAFFPMLLDFMRGRSSESRSSEFVATVLPSSFGSTHHGLGGVSHAASTVLALPRAQCIREIVVHARAGPALAAICAVASIAGRARSFTAWSAHIVPALIDVDAIVAR